MDKIQKFLEKLTKKQRLLFLQILADIRCLKLEGYDLKPVKGQESIFRLRKGQIRILFYKGKTKGVILKVAFRKDAY